MSAEHSYKHPLSGEDKAAIVAREYEDFAYIVSHDLSAPLRHVKEFTQLLVESRASPASQEEKEYIAYIQKSLERLDRMQQALLAFSRINTRALPFREMDCNQVVSSVLQELQDRIKEHPASIEQGLLPLVMAEPKQIHVLFFNLIDNALKFHEPGTGTRTIHISAMDQNDVWLFEIKDNGIGIEEKYYEEIFRLFRRLHTDKYPGIGAGLTIARKIVHRHGGEILIESEPGKGTSVFFSLPK
ncbi:MAG: GHKL domain-containing protein [Alphaproteobacteria bacterium]|nr:GHKL domain-containing protein [Alphaproteobacteria bacterium]